MHRNYANQLDLFLLCKKIKLKKSRPTETPLQEKKGDRHTSISFGRLTADQQFLNISLRFASNVFFF